MTRLTRETFLERFAGKAIDLAELAKDQSLTPELRARIAQADANGDGKIAGRRELERLFSGLDELDRDGSRHSLDVGGERAPTELGRVVTALAAVAVDRPVRGAAAPIEQLLTQHPELKTNQDLLNHFLGLSGGDWKRGQRIAMRFGVDLNAAAANRGATIERGEPTTRAGRSLARLVERNPALKTHQDLINHFLRAGGQRWGRATELARSYGVDLNQLTRTRQAPIELPAPPPAGAPTVTLSTSSAPPDGTSAPPVESPSAAPPPAPAPPPPSADAPSSDAPAVLTTSPNPTRVEPEGTLRQPFLDNERDAARMRLSLTRNQAGEVRRFATIFAQNRERYETVSRATGIPAELIAAIHYRESSMNFGTYLHQGDPLGRPAVHHPRDIPVFHRWEDAAIHALQQKDGVRQALGITADTTDAAALATFAERYNGLGYHNRGLASPYAWSGTSIYQGGRYVADGVFDPRSWDQRPGVIALMSGLQSTSLDQNVANQSAEAAWQQVLAGHDRLRRGESSEAVTFLQGMLQGLGYRLEVDGDFGGQTQLAIEAFQEANGLEVDGVVGSATAAAITAAFNEL